MTPLDMALNLASDGIPVFPCRRPDKRPTCPNGFYDATSDTVAVKRLWTAHRGNLIGVPTGPMSGLFAADIDSGRHASAAEWYQQKTNTACTRECTAPNRAARICCSITIRDCATHRASLRMASILAAKATTSSGGLHTLPRAVVESGRRSSLSPNGWLGR